jgi:hypothetical protein
VSRRFVLVRYEDPSQVSGTGVVAEGVEFSDMTVALRWLGGHPATAVWPSLAEVLAVHGHGGKTIARFPEDTRRVVDVGARIIPTSGVDETFAGRIEVQAHKAAGWLEWLDFLKGSADAATRVEKPNQVKHGYGWEWSWTSPDGAIRVYYITADPNEIRLTEPPASGGTTVWEIHDDPEMTR